MVMIGGMDNGNIIRIILPVDLYYEVRKDIDEKYDEHLKNGIFSLLKYDNTELTKTLFLEKEACPSNIIYAQIIAEIAQEISRGQREKYPTESYEIRTPHTLTGNYMNHNFSYIGDDVF